MQDYRRLRVWGRAHELALAVRRATRTLARSGHAQLHSQITRAAQSVPANIVEGCFAATPKEFARFLDISIKSSGELEYHLQLARDYGALPLHVYEMLRHHAVGVRRMLVALRHRVLDGAADRRRPSPMSDN